MYALEAKKSPLAPDHEMVIRFDTIAIKYIKFTSFLWAFTWCFLKLESYGALRGLTPMGLALLPVFGQQIVPIPPQNVAVMI